MRQKKKIYFKIDKDKKIKNIEELLIQGFGRFDVFEQTFVNEQFTLRDCHPARRSFEDLLCICKTYFPKTTKKELAITLNKLSKKIGLNCSYCYTIEKIVFHKKGNTTPLKMANLGSNSSRRGQGEYTLNAIQKLITNK